MLLAGVGTLVQANTIRSSLPGRYKQTLAQKQRLEKA